LLKHIGTPNTDIGTIMASVTEEVVNATERRQRPWFNTSLIGSVILNRVDKAPDISDAQSNGTDQETSQTTPNLELEKFMFSMAKESNDAADYQAYLDQFPNGIFASMARNAIERAEKAVAQQSQPNQGSETGGLQYADRKNGAASHTSTLTRTLNGPLVLSVTEQMRQHPSSEYTEQLLGLNRMQRRVIQARLNALGFQVGATDGSFGSRTRVGLSSWQTQNGLIPTGFLSMAQLELLTANSEQQYLSYVAANPLVANSAGGTRTNRSNSNGVGAATAAFIGGVILGKALD
jgi:hypothetical protein